MYADNTHITYASADLHSRQSSLNRDLRNIHKWLLCKILSLNSTKTVLMLIGSRQNLSTLSESIERLIHDISLKQVSTTKSLGILIDNNMAWHNHIDKLSKKIASSIGAIQRIRSFVSPEILQYRNFRTFTRTAGYPQRSIFVVRVKNVQQITHTGLLPATPNTFKRFQMVNLNKIYNPCMYNYYDDSIQFKKTLQPRRVNQEIFQSQARLV